MGKLYSALKMFHYQSKLDSLPAEQAITAPLHIRIKPTNHCNHACRYCAYRDPNQSLGKDMRITDSISRGKMIEIARDVVAMGVKAVTYSGGGEPLVYPYLLEASRILVDGGVRIACLTNGALLRDEKAEFFAHNAVWVRVSMDGWDDASYQSYRGVKDGEFTRIMRNIEAFNAQGGTCLLGVSYIVDNENYAHVREMLENLKNVGVRSVKVSACIVSNDAERNNAYHAPYFGFVQDTIRQAVADLGDDSFEILDAWHTVSGRFEKDYDWCPYIQINPVIAADMGVYPCHDKAYVKEFQLGSLSGQSFRQFWENGKDRTLSIRPRGDCLHHCLVNEKNRMLLEYLDLDPVHGAFV